MLNRVELIGRLGRDPEMSYSGNGQAITKISIATDRKYKNAEGNTVSDPTWFNVVLFGKLGETANSYLKKGQLTYIEGRIQTRSWQDPQSGEKRYGWSVVANSMLMLERGREQSREDENKEAITDEFPF